MKYLVILISLHIFIFSNCILQAQWVQLGNPEGGSSWSIAINGPNIFLGKSTGMYLSTDNGTNWTHLVNCPNSYIFSIAINGNNIFAATSNSVVRSTDNGLSWYYSNNGIPSYAVVNAFAFMGDNTFVGTNGGVFLSTNNGTNWTKINTGLMDTVVMALNVSGNSIFAGTYNGGIFLSTNTGTNWTQVNYGLTNIKVNAFSNLENNIFVATDDGVYRSTNNGTNWVFENNLHYAWIMSMIVNGANIFVGTYAIGLYISKDYGATWLPINEGLGVSIIDGLAVNDNYIFAVTEKVGVWRRPLSDSVIPVELTTFTVNTEKNTANLNWRTATETNNRGFEIQRKSSTYDFITVSFVNGKGTSTKMNNYSWSEKLQPGIYSYRLRQIDYNGKFEYSKEVEVTVIPNIFSLEQNYPNPFNPNTVISYSLPSASNVKLIVYNTLGQTIKVLENEYKHAGNYTVNFNASDLPSGIYFYTIQTISNDGKQIFTSTKKMILLK
jgi:photosystem II stability/assembly factor-like uncharacterized protein